MILMLKIDDIPFFAVKKETWREKSINEQSFFAQKETRQENFFVK